ncbi:alpha/beta hydrolase domain-containing protein [Georgenia sp. H159]|uniref:alpha/beta hydrolase domain-containing protein n=1 Tax=Georgenia sp. H159 TaxID=3076115 RepID=UPI002D779D5F|nr:alpha/beta hydrolase domain-containing protein [Georgenia sp. H159]
MARPLAALVAAATLTLPAVLGPPALAAPPGPERLASSTETVAAPTVSGPLARTSPVGDPSHGYPFLATDVDLDSAGYVEEEFLVSGEATRYAADGQTDATVTSTGHPYTTRIVVRRPAQEAHFNGVVIAEWLNVSNQWDQEVDWFQTHEHLMREGYTWVGVSAQRAGVHSGTGLRAWSPERYGTLDLTDGGTIEDDTLSFDVFSQAVQALRDPAGTDPLGPLDPDYVIATGHSQSAGRLHTYYNSVQPLTDVLDAVVLHGGGGPVRTDLDTPLFKLNSEGDVAIDLLGAAQRQPDSDVLRTWEVAGASHGDWKLITDYGPLRLRDIGTLPGGHPDIPQTCDLPSLSRVPQHQVQAAVYDHTVDWVAHGVQPPTADPIELDAEGEVVRDELGLAQGGIRLAAQEVPVRVNSGVNTGPGFCFLDGSSVPLPEDVLTELYPTADAYADQVAAATARAVERGHVPANVAADQAWYSDLSYLVGDLAAEERIPGDVASGLTALAERAALHADDGELDQAVEQLELVVAQVEGSVADAGARSALLRQAAAALAVLPGPQPEPEPEPEPQPEPEQRYGFFLNNGWDAWADVTFQYGRHTDEVLVGDWDGDGTDTITVRRGNRFYVNNAARGGEADTVIAYGRPGDAVLVGDWDGDGKDTLAVRRGAEYHLRSTMASGPADVVVRYGRADDEALVGDWDGDGKDTLAVRRGAQYHVKNAIAAGDADVVFSYGRPTDGTLAGDWDGDGRDTFAVRRGAAYHVDNSLTGGYAELVLVYGRAGDAVHAGDWDGDGATTLGVRRTP